ncbi:MAG TPA: histidine kinase dimerization/phospho-acceptor domain-containing protein [Pelomicrobium sp.]|nr:histidine kinase dimerization/phospho-acceptor domain-containing protein [Pelomicrobium sp.]
MPGIPLPLPLAQGAHLAMHDSVMPDAGGGDAGDAVPPAAPRAERVRWSLRQKGAVALLLVLAYALSVTVYLEVERRNLFDRVVALDRAYVQMEALVRTRAAMTHAMMEVMGRTYGAGGDLTLTSDLTAMVSTSIRALEGLAVHVPEAATLAERLRARFDAVRREGTRADWLELREGLRGVLSGIDHQRERLDAQIHALRDSYAALSSHVTRVAVALALAGLMVIGFSTFVFFTRLTAALKQVENRAADIVRGYRGPPLRLDREDEVGRLGEAVNGMARDLRERELRLQVQHERLAYEEKMSTLGALAAGIAHEVNNPLTTISGLAQQLAAGGSSDATTREAGQRIVAEVARAAAAARQLSEIAALQPADYEWIDVNNLVRRVARLLGYDSRYRGVRMDLGLDTGLPAVYTVGARLQQTLTELIECHVESMQRRPGSGAVRVDTCTTGESVAVVIYSAPPAERLGALRRMLVRPEEGAEEDRCARAVCVSRVLLESIGAVLVIGGDQNGLEFSITMPIAPGDENGDS